MARIAVLVSVLALATLQATGQFLAPLPSLLPPTYLPNLPVLPAFPSPYIPTLPPYVNVNPVVDVIAPIVDVQAYNALSCGCNGVTYPSCGCNAATYPAYGPTVVECSGPTSVSAPVLSPCGCGAVPTVPYSSVASPCGCGCGAVPTVPYSSVAAPCGCGLSTPLLPPLPPVVGCSKYLRQVCTQPPFL